MKHREHDNTPDCCSQKSSYSILKIVLWAGLAILLIAAAVQARAQSTVQTDTSAMPPDQAQQQNSPPDQAPPPTRQGRVVRLSYVQGQVQILSAGQTQFDQAVANMPLVEGSTLQTGDDGRAEVQFEDGSIARIVPGSQLQLNKLTGGGSGSLATVISLLGEEGYFELRPAAGDSFVVSSAGLAIVPVPSGSFRINLAAQPQQIAVSDGAVRVTHGSDYKVQVNADETLSLDAQDAARYLLASGTPSEPNDPWNEERDQYLNDAAAHSTGVQTGGDAAGWDDLDAYGSFYDVPGYGQVWQPYGYDANWDPFDAGYWAWYPWGYSWVSAYPWGWTPYHCGYWNYFDTFGWGWVGGGCDVGVWSPISVWYNPPHWWHRPLRPIWHPLPPQHGRMEPVGVVRERPFVPMPGKPVPRGWNPQPVTIAGHTLSPLKPLPPGERRTAPSRSIPLSTTNPPNHTAPAPSHGSPPPTWHGGSGYNRPAPAPHSAPPPSPPHSSPPASSGGGSHSEGGGGHK